MSRSTIITPIVGLLLCTALPALHAQEQPPAAIDPKACAPGDRMEFGERGPQAPRGPSQNLSDKLARTEGVLCPPPNVDPEIQGADTECRQDSGHSPAGQSRRGSQCEAEVTRLDSICRTFSGRHRVVSSALGIFPVIPR